MREVKERAGTTLIDPIDALVPRPRSLAVRLAIASLIVGLVGVGAWLFGSGTVYPQPDCCGNSPTSPMMVTTRGGDAVQLGVAVHNSSATTLRIDAATVVLPDAEVVSVGVVPAEGFSMPFDDAPLPAVLDAHVSVRLVVTFVPACGPEVFTRGQRDRSEWGSVTLDLAVADNGLLPSFGRSYRVPGALVQTGGEPLGVFPIGDQPQPATSDPLAAACTLLGR